MENSMFINESHLTAFAENSARALSVTGVVDGKNISRDILKDLKLIQKYSLSIKSAESGSFNEWIFDNWHLIRKEGISASARLRHEKKLYAVSGEALILRASELFLDSGNNTSTNDRLRLFLSGFQRSMPLAGRELYLFTTAVKITIISRLSHAIHQFNNGELAKNLITTLRFFSDFDFTELIEELDLTELALLNDPSGVYPKMAQETRRYYRYRLSLLADKQDIPEHLYARRIIRICSESHGNEKHVGARIFSKRKSLGTGYIAANVLGSLFFALLCFFTVHYFAALLLLLPISTAVKTVIDTVLLKRLAPSHIPRMDISDGVPPEGKTVCVISTLLTDEKSGEQMVSKLEEFYWLNKNVGKNLIYGILADLPETNSPVIDGSDIWIEKTTIALAKLNSKYDAHFALFVRPRVELGGKYMGKERKRGAILDLCKLLSGRDSVISCLGCDKSVLENTKFILTLDSDTGLTPDSISNLIGAMLHPLNRPIVDEKHNIVIKGHGIIQPRMSVALSSAVKTSFTRLFAGQGGTDPYTRSHGDVYMDLTGTGNFSGKGIIDIKAFLKCASQLPQNLILSHDAPEGALLRVGYMGDVELTETFPEGILSYFKRAHRWVRGDWQNLPLFMGIAKKFSEISKFKLFDSMRRSLVPIFTIFSLAFGFFAPMPSVAIIALSCFFINLIVICIQYIIKRPEGKERYHCTVISGFSGALSQCLVSLIILPYEAYVTFSAVLCSVYRMVISRKNLLEWTTASQSANTFSVFSHYVKMFAVLLIATVFIIFSDLIAGKTLGVIWVFSPIISFLLSRKITAHSKLLSHKDRCKLLAYIREMLKYFDDFLTEENHYLPPDNFQESPPVGLAKRTSPTNIGLCLVSLLTSADLGISEPDETINRIEKTIASIEKLPKWNGHLYNWYSTETGEVLSPRYVSTVDSGNLCASLVALASGLREYGFTSLALRCEALSNGMSFTSLYNSRKKLLRIGINTESNSPDDACYDLLAGETRLTAYLAVARGDVPKKLWENMSRSLVSQNGRRGLVSWTGTMFEYLMPELFLPLSYGSLIYESHSFCIYAQMKRSKKQPWGISESAYSALDPSLSYRYKAHGCQATALKPNMDSELVISPYSSFLALCLAPKEAVRNLSKLESFNMYSKYGFWEALDFTPSRTRSNSPEIVKCVMAHHIGMSIIASANCVRSNLWQRRFMRSPYLNSHRCLLEERIPVGTPILRKFESITEEFIRPERQKGSWSERGMANVDSERRYCVLSNGTYTLTLSNDGKSYSKCGDILMYAKPSYDKKNSSGFEFFLEYNGKTTNALDLENSQNGFFYTQKHATIYSHGDGLTFEISTCVCPDGAGELRKIKLSSDRDFDSEIKLISSFKPALAFEKNFADHPAFFGLGIKSRKIENGIVLKRLKRHSLDECFLCIKTDSDCDFDLSETSTSPRPQREKQIDGFLLRPVLRMDFEKNLVAKTEFFLNISLGFGASEELAIKTANSALKLSENDSAYLPELSEALLKLNGSDVTKAMDILPFILEQKIKNADKFREVGGIKALWSFGISGDYPIVFFSAKDGADIQILESVIKTCAYLHSLSVAFDLVIIVNDSGDYHRKNAGIVTEILAGLGLESQLGKASGIHVIDSTKDHSALIASACLILDASGEISESNRSKIHSKASEVPSKYHLDTAEYNFDKNGSFCFETGEKLTPRAWANTLTNGSFSYLATECGTGFMFMENAREFAITPWQNDPISTIPIENFVAEHDGKFYSLFSTGEHKTKVTYQTGSAIWESFLPFGMVKLTAFVPTETDARVVIIESETEFVLHWFCPLVMGSSSANSPFVVTDFKDGMFTANNARSELNFDFKCLASRTPDGFTCSVESAIKNEFDSKFGAGFKPCFSAKYSVFESLVLVCGCDENEKLKTLTDFETANTTLKNTLENQQKLTSRLKIHTPYPELDRAISHWIPYQVHACRILSRSSIYQSGGAVGFRDQLQDVVALIAMHPQNCREHILRSCAHQYEEGDVMHWWHIFETGDRGVRTRCSDDLVWLPWAVCEYVEKTGDRSILDEKIPFLSSPILHNNEDDRYETPTVTSYRETVSEHCERALRLVVERGFGVHGLLKIGSCDWNDGFDKIDGESVWLTWFFAFVCEKYAKITEKNEFKKVEQACISSASEAWDEDRFIRAYFKNGEAIGSKNSECCKVDSIAQSFSAFVSGVDKTKVNTALKTAFSELKDGKVTKLFTPPFEDFAPSPGYIQSYGAGFRENGGQYTHASIWLAMALLKTEKYEEALEILLDTLPENHDCLTYGGEPFVLSADVSANENHFGTAGWTWYTGSAGWYYRVVTEELLGVYPEDGFLKIRPPKFSKFSDYSFTWEDSSGKNHTVTVIKSKITVNGVPYNGKGLPL